MFVRPEVFDAFFLTRGSSGLKVGRSISLILEGLDLAMFFAFPVFFVFNLLKISMLLVEAAGVGRTPVPQST